MPVESRPRGKFGPFLDWVVIQHNCVVGHFHINKTDEVEILTTIQAPSGKSVVIPNLYEDESIPIDEYNYFAKRLGLPNYIDVLPKNRK
ncbi:MAG: hypothetical protein OXC68_00925 [Aestuariivita sp.]|nr:hypothetical protein [Aestuariivita sp.]